MFKWFIFNIYTTYISIHVAISISCRIPQLFTLGSVTAIWDHQFVPLDDWKQVWWLGSH